MKLDHLTLAVRDWRKSRDWYLENFGFRAEFELPRGGGAGLGAAAIKDDAGLTVFLEQVRAPIHDGQGSYTIQVDDVEKLYEHLSRSGLIFLSKPGKHFWGYGAVLADPDGHVLHLYDEKSMKEKGG